MLRDDQRTILAALLAEGRAGGMESLIKSGALTEARRVEIYRHNVMSNLAGALADIYPVTERIVGEAFFRHAASVYARATPSNSGDLNDFGGSWPAFIESWPHAAELPYLPDVGRLEWAMHRAFHAADVAPLDLSRLAAVAEADQGQLRFELHPAVSLISSPYPLSAIWRLNQPEYTGDMAIDWESEGEQLCVRREGYAAVFDVLDAPGMRFLSALSCHAPFEAAAGAALAVDSNADLQAMLIGFVRVGVIAGFRV
jgi:hypothetical protein